MAGGHQLTRGGLHPGLSKGAICSGFVSALVIDRSILDIGLKLEPGTRDSIR